MVLFFTYYNFFITASFSVEVFDSDRIGKDKSLGSVEISQDDLIGDEPKWFPLKVHNYDHDWFVSILI